MYINFNLKDRFSIIKIILWLKLCKNNVKTRRDWKYAKIFRAISFKNVPNQHVLYKLPW